MISRATTLFLVFSSFILSSCIPSIGFHRIPINQDGERIIGNTVKWRFEKIPTAEDLQKVDTAAYYVQVFEGRYYNEDEKKDPQILLFHNDGFFKRTSMEYRLYNPNKNSTRYGGKYKITEYQIKMEQFYPSKGGKTNYFQRHIRTANIIGDRIVIFNENGFLTYVFRKQYDLR